MVKRMLVGGLALLLLGAGPALAGKNNGGAMIVHTDNSVVYTSSADYCTSTMPATCEAAVTNSSKEPENEVAVLWFLAAFDASASPAVTTIQFGIRHNLPPDVGYFDSYAACGPAPIELPDGDFPEGGGDGVSGNVIAYGSAVTDHIFPFYWFGVVGIAGGFVGTRSYPSTDQAKFVDDNQPPFEDIVTRFGTMRWGQDGDNSCPVPAQVGGCCTPWASCTIRNESDCVNTAGEYGPAGGVYLGDNTSCPPQPVCGACCYWDNEAHSYCRVTTEELCYSRYSPEGSGGQYHDPSFGNAGISCAPSADSSGVSWWCAETAARTSTWGQLKSLFR